MRRVTVQRVPVKAGGREVREEADDRPAARPEIRKDIRKTWWPE